MCFSHSLCQKKTSRIDNQPICFRQSNKEMVILLKKLRREQQKNSNTLYGKQL